MNGEPVSRRVVVIVPSHAVTVHVQHTAFMPKGKVPRNLVSVGNHNGGMRVSQHIVGRITIDTIQISCPATAHIQQNPVIPASLNIQRTGTRLAPFIHMIGRTGQCAVHLYPGINHITGMVELVAPVFAGRDIETSTLHVFTEAELRIAYAQINCSIQHHIRRGSTGLEYQVLRQEQIGIRQFLVGC